MKFAGTAQNCPPFESFDVRLRNFRDRTLNPPFLFSFSTFYTWESWESLEMAAINTKKCEIGDIQLLQPACRPYLVCFPLCKLLEGPQPLKI